jgi:hypothetical protein
MPLDQLEHQAVMGIKDTKKLLPLMNQDLRLMRWKKDIILKLLLHLQLRQIFQTWKVS